MLDAGFFYVLERSPKLRGLFFRHLFEYLGNRYRNMTHWTHMNYGYAEGPGAGHSIALKPDREYERYCHQLYFRVVNGVDLSGKDIVEVSCGRGGGAAFIHEHFKPRTVSAIDVAASAIDFCRRVHRAHGLRFLQGAAEELPLFDESADALINVEASLCYGDRNRFFSEVHRILRPGAYFLYADLHRPAEVGSLTATLQQLGFELLNVDDITANVSRALELDSIRRTETVRASTPWFLRKMFQVVAGVPGTRIPTVLANGTMGYYSFVLRKRVTEVTTNPVCAAFVEV